VERTNVPTASGINMISGRRRTLGFRAHRWPLHAAIVVACGLWLVPTIALFVSSLRLADRVATSGWWTAFVSPLEFTLENYGQVLTSRNIGPSFLNSLLVAVPGTILPMLLAAAAAFAIARMKFRGSGLLFLLIVGLLIVPVQVTLVPVLRLFNQFGLTGTFIGIWLVHTGYAMPFAVYLLRNFFASLPNEIFESAYIDGASELTVFTRLALPLSVPALASLAIFQFMWAWNDLLGALIFLGGRPAVAPLTVTISNLVTSQGGGWQLLTAAAFISMTLPLLLFFALQRYFVRGILAGSVKG
jgi:alpha-glucoside transport system permease protein